MSVLDVRTKPCPVCGVPVFTTDNGCTFERPHTRAGDMSVQVLPGLLVACSPLPDRPVYRLHDHQAEGS